jgi:hypothetical protein
MHIVTEPTCCLLSASQVQGRLESHFSLCQVVEVLTMLPSFLYLSPVCLARQTRQGGQDRWNNTVRAFSSSHLGSRGHNFC